MKFYLASFNKQISRALVLVFVVFCLVSAPAFSQSSTQSEGDAPAQDQGPETAQTRMFELELQNRELQYKKDIAEIHADLIDRQTSWFEILVGTLGIIITAVVVYFSWGFGKSAVAEAKNIVRDDFDKMRREMETLKYEAEKSVGEIKQHRDRAKEITDGLAAGEAPQAEVKKRALRDIARDALTRPARDRTPDDYRALIITALMDEDWRLMERHAIAMLVLFENEEGTDEETASFAYVHLAQALRELERHEEAISVYNDFMAHFGESTGTGLQERVAYALYNKGVSLGVLNRSEEAITTYNELLSRFSQNKAPEFQVLAAKAMVNKAGRLGALDRLEEAIVAYDDLLASFENADLPELQRLVATALFGKGVCLTEVDRFDEAIEVYDDLDARFGDSLMPQIQQVVGNSLYEKARYWASKGKVTKSINALRDWGEMLDCDRVAENKDFDKIRDRPSFEEFLRESGCLAD